jgi:hypothetical protein
MPHGPCSKGDYDGAVQQYVKTIGLLEPSYVIRKVRPSASPRLYAQSMLITALPPHIQFLDAQRIGNLTTYLQALHESADAPTLVTADHTTLLLNCYTKLKDVAKLDEFLMVWCT